MGRVQTVYNVSKIEKTDFPTVRAQGPNRSKTETGNQLSDIESQKDNGVKPQNESNLNL